MANSEKFRLKLLIDEKRNKVVLAEANQDFADVLISLLTLPMGRIAKLLGNHKTVLGCYKNLNRSVSDMGFGHFETEACKIMLLCLKSTKGIHCKNLKLNMGDTTPTRFLTCPKLFENGSCSRRTYSNFYGSRCSCGALMSAEILVPEEEQVGEVIGNNEDGVFVNSRSSFIITDDLKVTSNSTGGITKVLNDLGYVGFSDLRETLLDVGFGEVRNLLGCLFTSEDPLTCAFLRETYTTRKHEWLSPPAPNLLRYLFERLTGRVCSVKVFVRKLDREILYAECNEDFVDSLLSFLALPLELACSLPYWDVLGICAEVLVEELLPKVVNFLIIIFAVTTICSIMYTNQECDGEIVTLSPNDPKVEPGASSGCGSGFMKKSTKFVVSNDLVITPMSSSSIIGLLKKMQVDISDLQDYQLSISKAELISILKASLISSSALTIGLSNLLAKIPKEEN
ncbi:unnamed protein product [Thlaspi arvense]|uniref:Uncharacterized protein n=1 Tax=Thlaspi arvense TaxID=13288 RepID=A0AAU9SHU8_THLAR|nr:unnamed protein product [Thlaspi arvense]